MLSCILVTRYKYVLRLSASSSRPTFLLAFDRAPVFFLYGTYVFTQYINVVSIDQKLMCSIQFPSLLSSTFLMAYY